MFDFENLEVYKKTLSFNREIFSLIKQNPLIDIFLQNQLKRASISILANIAEGAGRYSHADKTHFFIIARGSAYETAAFLNFIYEQYPFDTNIFNSLKSELFSIVRMIFGLTRYSKK
jgi:four helix bundle protein